jgi:mRNA-degrading endonuclease toxin of MazEF toxin-antitoxin module
MRDTTERDKSFRYGRIIWARVTDRRGNRKDRPCIILTPNTELAPHKPLLVMAVTTTFPNPPPRWHIPLPWNPDPRRVRTALAQRSAAVVDWLDTIAPADVLDIRGDVPAKVLREIEEQLREYAMSNRDK